MVSPEGEQLKLVEPIDPKGQNVEAWMLELEGNMRLTVRLGSCLPPIAVTTRQVYRAARYMARLDQWGFADRFAPQKEALIHLSYQCIDCTYVCRV